MNKRMNFNDKQKIAGLTPLNCYKRVFFYEDNRAMPLTLGVNKILGRSLQIFVIKNKTKRGRSPQIFVIKNKIKRGRSPNIFVIKNKTKRGRSPQIFVIKNKIENTGA